MLVFSGFAINCHETIGDSSDDTLETCAAAFDSCGTITQEGNPNLPSAFYYAPQWSYNQILRPT